MLCGSGEEPIKLWCRSDPGIFFFAFNIVRCHFLTFSHILQGTIHWSWWKEWAHLGTDIYECVQVGAAWLNCSRLLGLDGGNVLYLVPFLLKRFSKHWFESALPQWGTGPWAQQSYSDVHMYTQCVWRWSDVGSSLLWTRPLSHSSKHRCTSPPGTPPCPTHKTKPICLFYSEPHILLLLIV